MRSIEIIRSKTGLNYLNPVPVSTRSYTWIGKPKASLFGRISSFLRG